MTKASAKATNKSALRGQPPGRVRVYTAWHPLLVVLLSRVLPKGYYQLLPELQLAREPLRIDVVIVRRSRAGAAPKPHLLTSVVGGLAEHTLVHFKGPTAELSRDDARMLFAYALQYLVVAEIDDPGEVALRVVAPRLTPRFVTALRSLGCELTMTATGTHEGRLGVFPLRVVETVPVNARAGEHLLYTVTPGMLTDPRAVPMLSVEEREVFWALLDHVEQFRHPAPGQRKRHMKDEDKVVESFDAAEAALIARLPPERILRAYAPAQRLAGLSEAEAEAALIARLPAERILRAYAPAQRLAGLSEAETVLALPDAMLRGLSDEYLATLPRATRAAIRKRLGASVRPAAKSARRPAQRQKPRHRAG